MKLKGYAWNKKLMVNDSFSKHQFRGLETQKQENKETGL